MDIWRGVLYMVSSDRVILDSLREQIARQGPDGAITHTDLANATGLSRATAQRSIKRLVATGKVTGIRKRYGYQYRICDEHE